MADIAVAPRATAMAPGPSRPAREDARLFERYRRTGDQGARAELVARFLPLAQHLAGRYRDRGEYDDLVQVASVALIKTIDRYDPGRGVAFSSYAVPTIVGELKRYFRDHGWAVRVPRDLHDLALRVERESEQLMARIGRSPTPAEIAEALDSSVELVLGALQTASAHFPTSLDALSLENDFRGHPAAASEETGYAIAEASATLAPLLARLMPLELQILSLRFEHDLTQSEIGSLIGVSQMHVSRTLRKAIADLQHLAALTPAARSPRSGNVSRISPERGA